MKENPNCEIRKIFTWLNPESSNICCWIRNPWFWKSGTHSKESWILLPVIWKPNSTGAESGNPESTPHNTESKTRTPFHGFPHSRASRKRPPKGRRLGGCLRVSNYKSLLREEVPRHLLLIKQRLLTCSLYMWGSTLSLIKVLFEFQRGEDGFLFRHLRKHLGANKDLSVVG